MKKRNDMYDIAVVGGGPAGLAAALLLGKHTNFSIALLAPQSRPVDRRSTALWSHSVEVLESAGVWEFLRLSAYPLKSMRIVDATNRLFRAPQADFHSAEIDLEAFGYNVSNKNLNASLLSQVKELKTITRIDGVAESVTFEADQTVISTDGKDNCASIAAKFIIGADGRNSIVRKSANIGTREWSYPQSALVFDFEHKFPTNFTSTEFHTEAGPVAIVPHSANIAGLVWVDTPEQVKKVMAFNNSKVAELAEKKMHSYLGAIKLVSPKQSFPLSGMEAIRFGKGNCALVGEAGHQIPPIGAQGFNLGLRDVETICKILNNTGDVSSAGDVYHLQRLNDVQKRTIGIDLLNRSLLSDFLPVQLLRSVGVHAINRLDPLRKQVMHSGISY